MEQRTYNNAELVVTLGVSQITGWASGEFINITYDDDTSKFAQGADGEVARVLSNKTMATITLTLLQTSASNQLIYGYWLADKIGNAPVDFIIKDLSGNTVLSSAQTVIVKPSDVSYSDDVTNRVWTLKAANLIGLIGGNFVG